MHNDFVLVGPATDPAGIKKLKSAVEAFEEIAEKSSPFVSRGDDSGTNIKELDIWDDAGTNPMDFIVFVIFPEGQRLIADYKKHGMNLFYPDAIHSVIQKIK